MPASAEIQLLLAQIGLVNFRPFLCNQRFGSRRRGVLATTGQVAATFVQDL